MDDRQINCASSNDIEPELKRVMQLYELARASWPSFEVPREQFLTYLAERPLEPGPLDECRLKDLYLACGCVCGSEEAIRLFEQQYLKPLTGHLRRGRMSAELVKDTCQQVLVDLMVAEAGGLPRIAQYSGRGKLLSWLRATVVRAALKRSPAHPAAQDDDTTLERMASESDDPEIALIRNVHRDELRKAIRDAVSSLAPEDKGLFRLNAIDKVSTVELGHIYGVNQSTISRRLAAIRATVQAETKRLLAVRLGLESKDYRSMMKLLESDLDLNISQILDGADGDGEDGEPD